MLKMNKTALVIMAAGLGSRFGGVKQLEPVGPSGEIIMDYSIYDAIKAGFSKIVFIIRKDIEKDFKEVIGHRIEKLIEVEYVFQELSNLPDGYAVPQERTKPWGTGHAILSCKDVIQEPFAVINADDYYGQEAFIKVNEFLQNSMHTEVMYNFCMAGFRLGNTLSENGTVTRGVCEVNEDNLLIDIQETVDIAKQGNVAIAKRNGEQIEIALGRPVSMNMWGFQTGFLIELEQRFSQFLDNIEAGDLKAEYLLPTIVDDLIKEKKAQVTVLDTADKWFGVTYQEDKPVVVKSFQELINKGIYPEKLF